MNAPTKFKPLTKPRLCRSVLLAVCAASIAGCNGTEKDCYNDQEVFCFDRCIDPLSDNAYCGLDATCSNYTFCRADQVCQNGTCVLAPCQEGLVSCGGKCIDPKTDAVYCGIDDSCQKYTTCTDEQICQNGDCITPEKSCPNEGEINCGGLCIDPKTNPTFCGLDASCQKYTPCNANQICQNGQCVSTVAPCPNEGEIRCGGVCIDPKSNNAFCGMSSDCQSYEMCTGTTQCIDGACVETATCNDGELFCGGVCIDPKKNNTFCGMQADCKTYTTCNNEQYCNNGVCDTFTPTTKECPSGEIACGDLCIDPKSNPLFCGIKDDCTGYNVCAGGTECVDGTCKGTCDTGKVLCGGLCIDPLTNNTFCGIKDDCSGYKTCGQGETCDAGECKSPCTGVLCGGLCIDPKTNPTFCGIKDDCSGFTACKAGESCVDGTCQPEKTCENPDEILCGGICINPKTNSAFCGIKDDCTGYRTCASAMQTCQDGLCVNKPLYYLPSEMGCAQTDIVCGGSPFSSTGTPFCVDPYFNDEYCGADYSCSNYVNCTEKGLSCIDGACVTPLKCETGKIACHNSICIDPLTDAKYCGADELCRGYDSCSDDEICENGKCKNNRPCGKNGDGSDIFCGVGMVCDGSGVKCIPLTATCNGLEGIPLLSDVSHCGACNTPCSDGKVCQQGICTPNIPGKSYCDGIVVEVGNIDNCGTCGNKCEDGLICDAGTCKEGAGEAYCNAMKVNTSSDSNHCGACNNKCDDGESCQTGTCKKKKGNVTCNSVQTNTLYDSANCGECGHVCPAGSYCSSGVCTTANFDTVIKTPPYYCGTTTQNTTILYDSNHCGACNNKCLAADGATLLSCVNGRCSYDVCEETDDSGNVVRRIENVNFMGDSAHCGGCFNACPWNGSCQNGKCQLRPSHVNEKFVEKVDELVCDGVIKNVSIDGNNCGACGNVCPQGTTCLYGFCGQTCKVGDVEYHNIQIAIDSAHCGACNHPCAAGEQCRKGVCTPIPQDNYSWKNVDTTNPKTFICNGIPTNGWIDSSNCLGCGNACPSDKPYCNNGTCSDQYNLVTCNKYTVIERTAVGSFTHYWENAYKKYGLEVPNVIYARLTEIDLSRDSAHCGGCNQKCGHNEVCVTTDNVSQCLPINGSDVSSKTYCNGEFVDLYKRPSHCGQCDRYAGDGMACALGEPLPLSQDAPNLTCTVLRSNGQYEIVDVRAWNNPKHCGGCNIVCGDREVCVGTVCNPSSEIDYSKDVPQACNLITDVSSDSSNCGYCGNKCLKSNCYKGSCGLTCGKNNETTIATDYDAFFCGTCPTDADPAPATADGQTGICRADQKCQNGVCTSEGYVKDDENEKNRYVTCMGYKSIDRQSDSANCGVCGNICQKDAALLEEEGTGPWGRQGFAYCNEGVCDTTSESSASMWVKCRKTYINVVDDNNNCGQCDLVCPEGQTCVKGLCKTPE